MSTVTVISTEGSQMSIDKTPIDARRGDERAMHIGGNREKEQGERISLFNARRHNPPLVNDEGVEGQELRE